MTLWAKFSFLYLAVDTLIVRYKGQPVDVARRNNCCLFCESYKTRTYTVGKMQTFLSLRQVLILYFRRLK